MHEHERQAVRAEAESPPRDRPQRIKHRGQHRQQVAADARRHRQRGKRERDVPEHRHPRRQSIERLEHRDPVDARTTHRVARERDRTFDGTTKPAIALSNRRLAAAGRPEQHEAIRAVDVEADRLRRARDAFAIAVFARHTVDGDELARLVARTSAAAAGFENRVDGSAAMYRAQTPPAGTMSQKNARCESGRESQSRRCHTNYGFRLRLAVGAHNEAFSIWISRAPH